MQVRPQEQSAGDFFFQAEDGIRYLVRSRGLGDVYKRQRYVHLTTPEVGRVDALLDRFDDFLRVVLASQHHGCLLYTSDAADERSSVDLGGRRIIKKKIDVLTLAPSPCHT